MVPKKEFWCSILTHVMECTLYRVLYRLYNAETQSVEPGIRHDKIVEIFCKQTGLQRITNTDTRHRTGAKAIIIHNIEKESCFVTAICRNLCDVILLTKYKRGLMDWMKSTIHMALERRVTMEEMWKIIILSRLGCDTWPTNYNVLVNGFSLIVMHSCIAV